MSHVPTVQNLYAAFGRNDLPGILVLVAEDVWWGFNGGQPERVGYHRPVVGRDALPAFFAQLVEQVAFQAFEPRRFIDGGTDVVVEVHLRFMMKATGKVVEQSQLHWWTFDAAGKVARLVHYEDTAQVVAAAS